MSSPTSASPDRADSPRNMAILLLSRLALNLQFRIVYPFLPAIARGLGAPLETASLLITVRSLASTAAPAYGMAADRWGRRRMMVAGLLALVVGSLAIVVSPLFGVALVAFGLLGFAKSGFDPAAQAYIGDNVPYERRGRVLGILELAWALSWLVGVPLAGLAIARLDWRAPFGAISALGMIALLALLVLCPRCGGGPATRHESGASIPWSTVLPAMIVNCLLVAANENVFIVYGEWLETRFGLAVAAIGLVSVIIFVVELTGELASAGLVDRIGKRRAVLGGLALNVVAYILLPRLAGALWSGLLGVAFVFLTFEFSVVSLIPLVSELAPSARSTVLALNAAAASFGRVIASLSGPRLWSLGGLQADALVSAGIMVLAATVLYFAVHETPLTSASNGRL